MILLTAILFIGIEALYEGLALTGHKTIAGIIEGIYRAVVTLIVFAWLIGLQWHIYEGNYYFIIGGYLLMRFAIFDLIYNAIAGLPLTYIGKTKLSDKFWTWFFKVTNFPQSLFLVPLKVICFLIGVVWLLKK